ncbi:MAG TPA: hypothetical protein VIU65_10250 [Pyrinomonadaceae bacterium]
MNLSIRIVVAAVIVGMFAFSVAQAQEKKITRKQLPAAVEKTVARESEGATIKGFATEIEKGRKLYEVELTVNGHSKDILIDRNGNIVEQEEEVALDSLPAPVQDALRKAAGAGTIEMIESLTKSGKLVAYEAHVRAGKKRSEIQVGPNGEKLKRPE